MLFIRFKILIITVLVSVSQTSYSHWNVDSHIKNSTSQATDAKILINQLSQSNPVNTRWIFCCGTGNYISLKQQAGQEVFWRVKIITLISQKPFD